MNPPNPIEPVRIRAREGSSETERDDALAVEEPLEIRFRSGSAREVRTFAITMRTPGSDEELAVGLLFAEGVLERPTDLLSLERPRDPRIDPEIAANVLVASLSPAAAARAEALGRGTVMGSACGVCGKTSIENVVPSDRPPLASRLEVAPELLYELPGRLRERQSIFSRTGGLHAAALFSAGGDLLRVREDIGRHNATDKLVGSFFREDGLPLSESILLVSGRAGFEIVQKAFAAGIPVLAAVSAPSSLAVSLADTAGMTLVGFLRERRFNVYADSGRIRSSSAK